MNARQFLVNLVIVVVLLAIGGGIAYSSYEANNYVSTNNAQVSVPVVTVDALAAGSVASVPVAVGESVGVGTSLVDIAPAAPTGGAGAAAAAGATGAAATRSGAGRAAKGKGRAAGTATATSATTTATTTTPAAGSASAALAVTSPVAGVVSAVDVAPGQTVLPGQALVSVSEPANAMVVANVPETAIRNVADGQKVDVTFDAYPGTTFTGHVAAIQPATQASLSLFPASALSGSFTKVTQLVPVWIRVDAQGYTLYNGLSAEVRIHIGSGSL
jgi:multidrug resistance efflux pump